MVVKENAVVDFSACKEQLLLETDSKERTKTLRKLVKGINTAFQAGGTDPKTNVFELRVERWHGS